MRIVLLGPPGAGKGTQAKNIAREFDIPHISTGEIFRKVIAEKTPMGKKADEYIKRGLLVPDEIVIGIVEERMKHSDCNNGFILDGFPRTVAQAQSLERLLSKQGMKLDTVINIEVPQDELIERFTGRRICEVCGIPYHVKYNPPKLGGICYKCGRPLVVRSDDSIDTVKRRLKVYKEETLPLVNFYKDKGIIKNIDGTKTIEGVFVDIVDWLRGRSS